MSNSITRVKVWEGNYLIFQKFLSVFWIIIFLGSRDFLGFGHVIGYPDGIQLLINRLSLSNIAIILFSFLLFKRYKNYYTIDSFGRSFGSALFRSGIDCYGYWAFKTRNG